MLPIYLYGHPVLRTPCQAVSIEEDWQNIQAFIAQMWETMYAAGGVGLAANQVGKSWRIFVVDASVFLQEEVKEELVQKYKKTFINPVLVKEEGEMGFFEEGCLSVPGVYDQIERKSKILVSYWDENKIFHENEALEGTLARVFQHEYDHIEGKFFFDLLSPTRKSFLEKK